MEVEKEWNKGKHKIELLQKKMKEKGKYDGKGKKKKKDKREDATKREKKWKRIRGARTSNRRKEKRVDLSR